MRSYKLLSCKPHPLNPANITTDIEVSGDPSVTRLTDVVFGNDLTPERLAEQLSYIEKSFAERDAALASLQAVVNKGGTITLPTIPEPDAEYIAFQQLLKKLSVLSALEKQGAIKSDDPDLLALQQSVDTIRKAHPEYLA